MTDLLHAGFAQCDITPPLGLPLGGYGARVGGADAVLDPLSCRAAVFDDGESPLVIVALELVHVFGHWVERVRARLSDALGIRAQRLLVAATHTHAGPAVFRSSIERSSRVAAYEDELIDRVAACVAEARQRTTTAQLRFGHAPVVGVAANRRNVLLPVDENVRVLSAHAEDGAVIGAIADFACHPTVLSAGNYAYSGDLLGAAATAATRILGAPVLLVNGAAGDVSTRFTRRAQTADEVRRLGHTLADGIAAALHNGIGVVPTPLTAAITNVAVRWRELPAPDAASAQLFSACAELETLRAQGAASPILRRAESRVEGAQAAVWLASHGGWPALFGERSPVVPLQALRCGDLTIVAAPGELFAAAGRWLYDHLAAPALVIGYANDYLGYFIPAADADSGGYESLVAMLDPACETAIRDGLLQVARAAGCRVGAAAA